MSPRTLSEITFRITHDTNPANIKFFIDLASKCHALGIEEVNDTFTENKDLFSRLRRDLGDRDLVVFYRDKQSSEPNRKRAAKVEFNLDRQAYIVANSV